MLAENRLETSKGTIPGQKDWPDFALGFAVHTVLDELSSR
jgi:hypothetical protein